MVYSVPTMNCGYDEPLSSRASCGAQIIQRRCQKCEGSGLVMKGRFARKCPECGGFFPWQVWTSLPSRFWWPSEPSKELIQLLPTPCISTDGRYAASVPRRRPVLQRLLKASMMIQGWRRFFTSTALPGNGGPLRQPRGQTSIFYK